MKNKYTKKNNRSKKVSDNKVQETDIFETDNLLERILMEERESEGGADDEDTQVTNDFNIDIIGMSSDDDISSIEELDDDLDEDMASRLSLYDSIEDDEEDEIQEFISRDYDVVAESRRRVNQPGKRKFETEKNEKKPKDKKVKSKVKKEAKEKIEKSDDSEPKANIFKTLLDKWNVVYKEHTLQILFEVLGLLTVILIVAIIVVPKNIDKDDKKTGKSTESTSVVDNETKNPMEEQSTEKNITMADLTPEAEDSSIYKLITGFIDAERVQCDIEKAKSYLEVAFDEYNLEQYEFLNRYIEGYQDIKCYKFDYISDNMYYVFVSYKTKIRNIDTLAVAADTFVVRYNEEQDKYMIVTSYTKEEYAYNVIVENSPEVKLLQEDVLTRQNEALAKDKVLKEFIEIMQGAANSEEQK